MGKNFLKEKNKMKNISFIICEIAQNEQFFECYQFSFLNNLIESILTWLLIFSTIFANSFVIILIHRNSDKITIFDQILIKKVRIGSLRLFFISIASI